MKRRRGVTWEQTAAEPRACVRCFHVKEASAFPPHGRVGTKKGRGIRAGVTRLCWACIEAEAHAMCAAGYKPRIRLDWTTPKGAKMRMCTTCKRGKPATRRYFSPLHKARGLARTCRKCRTGISTRSRARQREREGERLRARHAELARKRRKDPKVKASEREARKRWRAKLKATEEGRARLREGERMGRRLKREREGKGTGKPRAGRGMEVVPSAPLIAFIERIAERRRELARVLDEPAISFERLCDDLGVSARLFRRWQSGEYANVEIGVVERVLLNADVEWHEVYSYDDYAARFLAAEVEA